MAAKRIAQAATLEELLKNNPDLTFQSSLTDNCQFNGCSTLPQEFRDRFMNRFSNLPPSSAGYQARLSDFQVQRLAAWDRYLISSNILLTDESKPAVIVAAVVDAKLNVDKVFSVAFAKAATGVEADPKFGTIRVTWAEVEARI